MPPTLGYVTHLDSRMTFKRKIPLSIGAIGTPYWPLGLHRMALARPNIFATVTLGSILAGRATYICYFFRFFAHKAFFRFVPPGYPLVWCLTIGTPVSPISVPPIRSLCIAQM